MDNNNAHMSKNEQRMQLKQSGEGLESDAKLHKNQTKASCEKQIQHQNQRNKIKINKRKIKEGEGGNKI